MLKEIMKQEYKYYGVRVDSYKYEIGATPVNSTNYNTDTELNGVSAIELNVTAREEAYIQDEIAWAISYIKKEYGGCGKYVTLVASNDAEDGTDAGEILMSEPVVLKVIAK